MAEAIKDADLNVDEVYFLRPDSDYPIVSTVFLRDKEPMGAFRNNFKVKELDLSHKELKPAAPFAHGKSEPILLCHVHIEETRKGDRILVCYQMNGDKILVMLDGLLRDLQDRST